MVSSFTRLDLTEKENMYVAKPLKIKTCKAVQWYFTKRWAFSALKLGCLVSRYCIIHIFYNYGPIPASFCIFSLFSHYITIMQIEKKHRCCAWDSNPGPQDGRRRRNHRAMAATPNSYYFFSSIFLALPLSTKSLSKMNLCLFSCFGNQSQVSRQNIFPEQLAWHQSSR